MSGKLSNLAVIITRQGHAAKELQQLLTAYAATCINLPLFAIEATITTTQICKIETNLQHNYFTICISPNAIEQVLPKIQYFPHTQWATVGPASAKHLQKYNISNIIYPSQPPYDGRALIAEMRSRSINFEKLCIMILTGEQGNEWLATELQNLGAVVELMPVYKRVMPHISVADFKSIMNAQVEPPILVITCVTSLVNLQILGARAEINIYKLPLLVVSQRIYTYAKLRGFVNIGIAKSTNASDILTALFDRGEKNERTVAT